MTGNKWQDRIIEDKLQTIIPLLYEDEEIKALNQYILNGFPFIIDDYGWIKHFSNGDSDGYYVRRYVIRFPNLHTGRMIFSQRSFTKSYIQEIFRHNDFLSFFNDIKHFYMDILNGYKERVYDIVTGDMNGDNL